MSGRSRQSRALPDRRCHLDAPGRLDNRRLLSISLFSLASQNLAPFTAIPLPAKGNFYEHATGTETLVLHEGGTSAYGSVSVAALSETSCIRIVGDGVRGGSLVGQSAVSNRVAPPLARVRY